MNKTSLKQTPLSKLQADKQRLHLLCRIQEQKLNEEVLYMRENAGRLLFSGISALFSTSGSSKSEKKKRPFSGFVCRFAFVAPTGRYLVVRYRHLSLCLGIGTTFAHRLGDQAG